MSTNDIDSKIVVGNIADFKKKYGNNIFKFRVLIENIIQKIPDHNCDEDLLCLALKLGSAIADLETAVNSSAI